MRRREDRRKCRPCRFPWPSIRKLADTDANPDIPSKALFVLKSQQPTSLKNLCEILGVSASAGSILVDKYVKSDLIERSPDPKDRRKIVLSLTPKGEELLDQHVQTLHRNLNATLEVLSEEENAEFHAALETTAKYIHKLYPLLIQTSR